MSGLTLLRSDSYVRELRRQMVRFAALRLRDPALAEDVVQATLVAALEGAATFSWMLTLKTFAELESTEIPDTLGISANNLHVVLHGARRRLRACLENCCPLQCEPCPAERTQQSFRGRS